MDNRLSRAGKKPSLTNQKGLLLVIYNQVDDL